MNIQSENVVASFKLPKIWFGTVERAVGALLALAYFDDKTLPSRSEQTEFMNAVEQCASFEEVTRIFNKYFIKNYSNSE